MYSRHERRKCCGIDILWPTGAPRPWRTAPSATAARRKRRRDLREAGAAWPGGTFGNEPLRRRVGGFGLARRHAARSWLAQHSGVKRGAIYAHHATAPIVIAHARCEHRHREAGRGARARARARARAAQRQHLRATKRPRCRRRRSVGPCGSPWGDRDGGCWRRAPMRRVTVCVVDALAAGLVPRRRPLCWSTTRESSCGGAMGPSGGAVDLRGGPDGPHLSGDSVMVAVGRNAWTQHGRSMKGAAPPAGGAPGGAAGGVRARVPRRPGPKSTPGPSAARPAHGDGADRTSPCRRGWRQHADGAGRR